MVSGKWSSYENCIISVPKFRGQDVGRVGGNPTRRGMQTESVTGRNLGFEDCGAYWEDVTT